MLKLGVTFDENFNFKQRISKTCRCCFYLRRIRRYVSLSVAQTIAITLTSSKFEYCNPLHNTASKYTAKFQRVQQFSARVVTRSTRCLRSMPRLKSLHWLPVHYVIILKMCTIAYQALSSIQPSLHSSDGKENWNPRLLYCRTASWLEANTASIRRQPLTHCLRLRYCLITWFCRATELDLRRYWRTISYYY